MKPFYRRRMPASVWCALALALGALAVVGVRAAMSARADGRLAAARSAFAEAGGTLDVAACRPSAAPGGANGAPDFAAAAAILADGKAFERLWLDLGSRPARSWSDGERARLAAALAPNARSLADAERAAASSVFVFAFGADADVHADPGGAGNVGPLVLSLTRSARWLRLAAGAASADGDAPRALAAVETLAALAAATEAEARRPLQFVGFNVAEAFLAASVADLLDADLLDARGLARVAARLAPLDLRGAWRRGLDCEAADYVAIGRALAARRPAWLRALDVGRERIFEAQALRLWGSVYGAIDEPFGESPDWRGDRARATRAATGLAAALPATMDSAARYQMAASLRGLARTAVALRLAALRDGAYPASLAAWAGARAADPFAGRAPRYSRRADGSFELELEGGAVLARRLVRGLAAPLVFRWEGPPPRGLADAARVRAAASGSGLAGAVAAR
ncbi:MAG: hypothetical protein ABFD84_02565 [Candidatus Polarisedimenticolia bacterium]